MARRDVLAGLAGLGLLPLADAPLAWAQPLAGLPDEPLIVAAAGRRGGTLRMLISAARDVQYMVVYGYARLLAFGPDFDLAPDILKSVEVEGEREFRFRLRAGHRWSDGAPFTTEDFRYWWEDVANDPALSPAGPPIELQNRGVLPEVEILSPLEIVFRWPDPNPRFLPALAGPRPLFLYRPAHYLKAFHARHADGEALAAEVAAQRLSGWAALHNRRDNLHRFDNPDLPTLQPWRPMTAPPARRFVMERNPHFHRVDGAGVQLPYIDRVELQLADQRLFPAKAIAGETDLQARGLGFPDAAVLRAGETRGGYRLALWREGVGSTVALYPNLNAADPLWRGLLRDARLRRALSLGIDRPGINAALFLNLARGANNTVLPGSPLYTHELAHLHAAYNPDRAELLLDEAGLTRTGPGWRTLPDGRIAELVVETAGESETMTDILLLIAESWRRLGLRLLVKASERSVLRNRVYAGEALLSAWPGFDLGLATPDMPPDMLAPVRQDMLCWPKWGQYHETRGTAGEPVDLPEAARLMELWEVWSTAKDRDERAEIWRTMLAIHADQQFTIGTVSDVLQPVVVSRRLEGVPASAVYAWTPTAFFGVYRPDQFWFREDGA
ncbi:MAG: ABC transporter substrate-binding protein [Alphaproteobacteria bacterium]|nr:ABC transporter substrate-binding protein [Alphaproteobacteria bacterium]